MDEIPVRHPQNSAGPFYVENGQCISCGAPESEADGLIEHDANGHCFFARQPSTENETNAAIRGVWATCCGAVRYGGDDPQILARLAALGMTGQCDGKPLDDHSQTARNCARFEYSVGQGVLSRRSSLGEIIKYIAESLGKNPAYDCFAFRRWLSDASFRVRWGKVANAQGYMVRFKVTFESADRWLLRISENEIAHTAFAIQLDKALQQNADFRNVRWLPEYQLLDGEPGKPHPY
jgi:hypothetical protein